MYTAGPFQALFYQRRGGLSGLGAEPEAGCDQPVHYTERDKLRNEIKGVTSPYAGQHIHEGHYDVRRIFEDIQGRLRGLEQRPKLLRCSAEARDRARRWLDQITQLRRIVERHGTKPGTEHITWVSVREPISFQVYRGPSYTIRPGTPHPENFSELSGAMPPRIVGDTPTAGGAPGAVVVAGDAKTASGSPGVVSTTGGDSVYIPPSSGLLDGSVAGIPTRYLLYGLGGLLAWKMVGR